MSKAGYILAIALLLGTGCYDSRFSEEAPRPDEIAVNYTLRQLKEEFRLDEALIKGDIIVKGRITTSDREGNFYRTLFIEEEGCGMELMLGLHQLHNDYPEGMEVAIEMKGMKLCRERGIIRLGHPPVAGSGFTLDYIASSRSELDPVLHRLSFDPQPLAPRRCTTEELTKEMCGALVCVTGLHFVPEIREEGVPADESWKGNKRFEDADGNCLFSYVRPYARFAEHTIPEGVCSLTGILQYDERNGGYFGIKIRDEHDCQIQTSHSGNGGPSAARRLM